MVRPHFMIIQIVIAMLLISCDISGSVKDMEAPMEGVTLTLSGNGIEQTVVTDTNGEYIFKSIPAGEYEITPKKDGVIFYPKKQPVIQTVKSTIQVNFKNFNTMVDSISILSVPGMTFVKTGADLKVMAVGKLANGKEIIVSEFLNWRSENEDICQVKNYSQLTVLASGIAPGTATLVAETDMHHADMTLDVREEFYQESDLLIPGFPPPPTFPRYIGGCCIETCIWAILNAKGIDMSIEEITALGDKHPKGWGLGSMDITSVLKKLEIEYIYTITPKTEGLLPFCSQTYEEILREKVIGKIKQGIPVMLGLKYLPYHIPYLPMDHFVLVLGYNEDTDEIIYNDINQVNRSTVTKLVDGSFGYSANNFYDVTYIIEFPGIVLE